MDADTLQVTDNRQQHQFEVRASDGIATLTYDIDGGRIALIHTEVPEQLEGRGIGSKLAVFALGFARERGLRVIPNCPFVASYIERHPEYADLVDAAAG